MIWLNLEHFKHLMNTEMQEVNAVLEVYFTVGLLMMFTSTVQLINFTSRYFCYKKVNYGETLNTHD